MLYQVLLFELHTTPILSGAVLLYENTVVVAFFILRLLSCSFLFAVVGVLLYESVVVVMLLRFGA